MVTKVTTALNLQDVAVSDRVAASFFVESSEPPAARQGDTLNWDLGNLPAGQSRKIVVKGRTTEEGSIETCAVVVYTPVLCLDTMAVRPEVAVRYEGDPSNLMTCDTVTYTVTVSNTGTGPAGDVVAVVDLPSGLKTAEGGSTVRKELGTLAPAQVETITFTAQADGPGAYTSNVKVTSNVGDLTSNDVTTAFCKPAIVIETVDPPAVYLGNNDRYDITVRNTGECDARDVVLTAEVPACARFISATNEGAQTEGLVTWNLGTVPAGGTRMVSYRLGGGDRCETQIAFKASGYCCEASKTSPFQVVGIPAILLEVVDLEDPVRVGNGTTYVITATNQGSADGTNIVIVASVEQMTISGATGATAGAISGKSVRFAPFPTLAPGEKAEWRVTVNVDAAGGQPFSIEMTSDQLQRPVKETEATNCYE